MKKKRVYTNLIAAVLAKEMDTAERLLNQGADPNARDEEYGETVLSLAVCYGTPRLVTALLDKGAVVNAVDNRGRTALWSAWGRSVLHGEKELPAILEILLKRGADPNLADPDGKTPLMKMIELTGEVESVSILINHGADINAVSDFGDTPLSIAQRYGPTPIAEFLSKMGAVA